MYEKKLCHLIYIYIYIYIYTFYVQIFGANGLGWDFSSRLDLINLRDTTECNDEETDSIQTRRQLPSDKVTCRSELCLLSHNSHSWSR
jgi:hypothetical protein